MTTYKSDFLNVLHDRGLIHQVSDAAALDAACCKGPVTAYVGYDATATSLHIGNLISVTMLYWFQQTGHRPITLMGGGTSMVGDPSFRDDQRQMLTVEDRGEHRGYQENLRQDADLWRRPDRRPDGQQC